MNTPIQIPGTSVEIRHEEKTWFNLLDLGTYLECSVKQRASTKNKWAIKMVKGKDATGRRRNLKYIKNTSLLALLKRCKDETKVARVRELCMGAERRTPEQEKVVQAIKQSRPPSRVGSGEADFIEVWLNFFPQKLRASIRYSEHYAMLWRGLTQFYPGLQDLPEVPTTRRHPYHQEFLVSQQPFIYGMRLNKGFNGRKRDELYIDFTDLKRCFDYREPEDVEGWLPAKLLALPGKEFTTSRMDDNENSIKVTHCYIPCGDLKHFWTNCRQRNATHYERLVDRVAEFQG